MTSQGPSLPGHVIVALEYLSTYDHGHGVTLAWVSPGLWKVGASGCMVTADTVEALAHAALIEVGELAESRNETATVTQAGRDYLNHHHNARRDNQQ